MASRVRPLKLGLLGNSSCGKTALVQRYTKHTFTEDSAASIRSDVEPVSIEVEEKEYSMHIWDSAGQERFQALVPLQMKKCDGVILVFDVTNKESFNKINYWNQQADMYAWKAKRVLVGNKCDKERDNNGVSYEQGRQKAAALDMQYIETSAKTGEHVDEMFKVMAARIVEDLSDEDIEVSTIILDEAQPKVKESERKQKKCC